MVPAQALRAERLRLFLSQPRLAGADDGLRPVRHLQPGEDVGDVVADRFGAEVEAFGDLGVRLVAGDEGEYLALAVPPTVISA